MSESKDIFKKFSQSARQILIASQKVAQNMNSGIGSEHLLLAMTITTGNLAYDLLKENAINLDQVKLILSLNNIRTNLNNGLSKEVKDILERAAKKSQSLKHNSIDAEHILWAIADEKESRAYQIIKRIGISPEEIKQQLDEIFAEELPLDQSENTLNKNLGFIPFPPINMPLGFETLNNLGFTRKDAKGNKSNTPLLDQFGVDLTLQARQNKLDPVIGRQGEIARAIQILSRRTKNNPVLVGEPGVGKTAIVEGLAQLIQKGQVPQHLKDKRIVGLDLAMTVAGTMYRGQFEDRIKRIIQEVTKAKNIILFIDELHSVVGAGSAEGSIDAANILKPSLAKGQIKLIGATTLEEYRKHIEKDAALERRLQIIKVDEPTASQTIEILRGITPKYEEHHGVKITDEAILAATELSNRYIFDRHLPDKAIDLIDEAAAAKQIFAKIKQKPLPELDALQNKLTKITELKTHAAGKQDYQEAAKLKTEELKLQQKINIFNNKTKTNQPKYSVQRDDIAKVVSTWTSIPLENLVHNEIKRFVNLENRLRDRIIGQDEAISSLAQAIRRTKSGIANPNRPIGAFIFLGPTGVGKTELAKVLAEDVFAKPDSLVKIDMSEFMEKHNISRLVGAPPGYVGYEDAGKLTEAVRRNPYCVILLDEIEKAHHELFNLLLQIFEDGYLTDAKGHKVNFRNTIIIMTSNIGVTELNRQAAIGFQAKNDSQKQNALNQYQEMKELVLSELKKAFRPEFVNRLDKIIVFKPLDKKAIRAITELQINDLKERLLKQKIKLQIEPKVSDFIAENGFDPKYGARPIRRLITDLIENQISDKIISGESKKNKKIIIYVSKTGKIIAK